MSAASALALRVERLLASSGTAITLTSTNATTGAVSSRQGVAAMDTREKHVLADAGVVTGDWRLILNAAAAPTKNNRLTFGAQNFILTDVQPIYRGATPVAYWVWAREGA
jgi:hypothetical protein